MYYENIVINSSINLVGEDKYSTIIDGGRNDDVIYISSNSVTVSNFTIKNTRTLQAGVRSDSILNLTIRNNILTKNFYGAYMTGSSCNNIISDNLIMDNWAGIIITNITRNNTLFSNTFFNNNMYGMIIEDSSNITVSFNKINQINYYGKVSLVNSSGIIFHDNILENNTGTIRLKNSDHNYLFRNTFLGNVRITAISLDSSSNNSIIQNNISNNGSGIVIHYSCNNILRGNDIKTLEGIDLKYSHNNTISENTLLGKDEFAEYFDAGIYLDDSNINNITGNVISMHLCGILFGDPMEMDTGNNYNNRIYGNNIIKNFLGIFLQNSYDNEIISNNFRKNKMNAFFNNCNLSRVHFLIAPPLVS